MKFWIILILGLFFAIGGIVNAFLHMTKINIGIILDIVVNPAFWLGVILIIVSFRIKKKTVSSSGR